MLTPSFLLQNSTAARIAVYESRLQQRGPPYLDISDSAREVISFESDQGSPANGVEPVTMDTNIPVLIPAPQAPQNPQAPPGTLLPREIISFRDASSSMFPPELRYAVKRDAPTST